MNSVRSLPDLARAVAETLELARGEPGVGEVEVFAASNAVLLARLNYTSHIPCNGVEEPKSTESFGLGVRATFETEAGRATGFGSEPADLSSAGGRRALAKARRGAVVDPDFVSLPKPTRESRTLDGYHDARLMDVSDEALVGAGWTIVNGGLRTFLHSPRLAELAGGESGLAALGLILGGDVTILQERIAIASSSLPRVETDESTIVTAFVTAMVERHGSKGSGSTVGTRLDHFTDDAGTDAAMAAIDGIGGERVPSGTYTVVFGRQPVTDLINNLIVPACTATAFHTMSTPFLGRVGRRVASPWLSVYDHGGLAGLAGSKGVTCEGLPTGRTDLIRHGILSGCLANWYESRRLLRDPRLGEKLGATGDAAVVALAPRNGFRFGAGGGRMFDVPPGIAASNVIVEGADPVTRDELLRLVGDGLYIGRIWYTYPINGLRAGDFTCTVVADSYIIRNGRIAGPIRPNTIRINDNIATFLNNVLGVTKDAKPTIVWAADEVVYAPEIAVSGVRVDAIDMRRLD
ncbi:MAG: TldD/PmbA family protein [Candidatus Rokuibacteriota bacterium]